MLEKFNIYLQKSANENYEYESDFTIESKDEFKKIVNFITINNYSTNHFLENLKTLKIRKNRHNNLDNGSSLFCEIDGYYDSKNNLIHINNWEAILHELLHVASSDKNNLLPALHFSFAKRLHGKMLQEGFTDYLTSLIDPNYQIKYPFEVFVASTLISVYGSSLIKSYFLAESDSFYNNFGEDEELIKNLVILLDRYRELYEEMAKDMSEMSLLYYMSHINDLKLKVIRIITILKIIIKKYKIIDIDEFNKNVIYLFGTDLIMLKRILTEFGRKNLKIDNEITLSRIEEQYSKKY